MELFHAQDIRYCDFQNIEHLAPQVQFDELSSWSNSIFDQLSYFQIYSEIVFGCLVASLSKYSGSWNLKISKKEEMHWQVEKKDNIDFVVRSHLNL